MRWACLAVWSLVFALCACSDDAGTSAGVADRQVAISAQAATDLLTGGASAPTAVRRAQAVQVALGSGGGLGPTDYVFYGAIRVAPADLPRWAEHWKGPVQAVAYEQPPARPEWWPLPSAFEALEFYAPVAPRPGQSGFVAVDRKTHTIYFSFTTS